MISADCSSASPWRLKRKAVLGVLFATARFWCTSQLGLDVYERLMISNKQVETEEHRFYNSQKLAGPG